MEKNFKSGVRRFRSRFYRCLPDFIVDKFDILRSYRLSLFFGELPIFIHMPRNGGTFFSHILYGRQIQHISAKKIRLHFPRIYKKRAKVAIYRDPVDRFISSANYIRMGGTSIRPADYKSSYECVDLDDIDSIIDYLYDDHSDRDQVFRPQSDYIDEDVDVFCISDLQVVFEDRLISYSDSLNNSNVYFTKECLSRSQRDRIMQYYVADYDIVLSGRYDLLRVLI